MNGTRLLFASLSASLILLFGPVLPSHMNEEGLAFINLDMIDAEHGWAIVQPSSEETLDYRLLRTEDGSQTWTDVSPPSKTMRGEMIYWHTFEALDTRHAWIIYPSELWHTRDGGQSWQLMTELEPRGYYHMDFVDEHTGWLLELDCCAAGNEFARLFRTLNAGASWQLINSDALRFNLSEDIRHDLTSARHTGMDFYDGSVGWMTLGSIIDYGGILQTDDGGQSWYGAAWSTPLGSVQRSSEASRPDPACNFLEPRAFSTVSFSALGLCRAQAGGYALYLYATQDGGRNWISHRLPFSPQLTLIPIGFEMMSPDVAWISGSPSYRTTDGGQTWVRIAAIDLDSPRLDFVDAEHGWLINPAGELLETIDGGDSWMPVQPRSKRQAG